MQSKQVLEPTSSVYLPDPQVEQKELPSPFANVPFSQSRQDVDEVDKADFLPATQDKQFEFPVVSVNLPLSHSPHEAEPAAGGLLLYLPFSQGRQSDAEEPGVVTEPIYNPALQAVHSVFALSEYFPTAQSVQATENSELK